ncbi:MAG: phosphoglycerate kinase [Candidatus Berkelbacteria bacterium]|nr:phosphoglycerate kinase [Candidatus Berkelbacteria bacterium]
MKLVQEAEVADKRVFLRVDFNVPVKDGEISDLNRIRAVLPTIKYLVESRCKLIIGTHLGRPEGKPSEETSIAPVARELQRMLNLKVAMAPGIFGAPVEKLVESLQPGGILVLENLRWDKREEENDAGFAKELAQYADVYVNDAFAVSHRANASVEAITKFLPSFAGLLLQSEIENLGKIIESPKKPFIIVVGGVKIKDKAGMIEKLAPKADKILIGGGVANTFLKARGEEISESVYDTEMVADCEKMLKKLSKKIILPIDSLKEEQSGGKWKIMDIGPDAQKKFAEIIKGAETVLWNGNLGYTESEKYRDGSLAVAKAMSQLVGKTSVIAGGDTVGFVKSEGLDKNISFISTGGGAALEFLAGEKLPGIEALK